MHNSRNRRFSQTSVENMTDYVKDFMAYGEHHRFIPRQPSKKPKEFNIVKRTRIVKLAAAKTPKQPYFPKPVHKRAETMLGFKEPD